MLLERRNILMYRLFRSELLKSKRTLLRPTLFIGAVIFSILLLIVANLAPDTLENSWEHYTKMIFNMWTISFNTLGISLLCILTEYTEKKNNTYRSIYVEARSTKRVWVAKIFALAFYSFMTTALLTIFVCILALLNHLELNTIISVLEMGGITWITSLPIIPIALFCTHNFKTVGALGIGFFGFISAPIMAPENYWIFNPYSYGVRGVVPITKLHPNGIVLENTSELLKMINEGQLDFALVEGYFNKLEYDYRKFCQDEYICVGSIDFPLSIVHDISELFKYNLIIRENGSGSREIIERWLKERNLDIDDFSNIIEIGNINMIKRLVKNNHGITFIYKLAVEKELAERRLKQVKVNALTIKHDINFIWRKNSVFNDYYEELFEVFRLQNDKVLL